jgi:hypothetical protein
MRARTCVVERTNRSAEPTCLFDDAFKVSLALDIAKQALASATKPTRRMAKRVRALEARITPPKKRRAIEARRSIVACAREYIAAHGAPWC